MIRGYAGHIPFRQRIPRESGDDPLGAEPVRLRVGYSPRERG